MKTLNLIILFGILAFTADCQILGKNIINYPLKTVLDTSDLLLVSNPHGNYFRVKYGTISVGGSGGAGVTDGSKVDLTVNGDTWTINNGIVSNTKLATMSAMTFKANISGSVANAQDVPVSSVITALGINAKFNYSDTVAIINKINAKQDALVSGVTIKTVNGNSLIGTGNISISSSVAWGGISGSILSQTDLVDSFLRKTQYNKSTIGLGNVDNTSDLNKPLSTAAIFALSQKQAQLVSAVNIKTINNIDLLGSGNITISGGGGGGSQTLDDVLGVGNNSGTQMILGGTTADTWHANTGDPYPVLSLDKTNTDFNNYSPILNFKGAADGGIIWQFNPLALGIDEAAPYSLNYGIARDLQYEGINNASYTFGFNLNATGARLDVNNPSFGNTIETNYEISQHGWCLENYTSFTAIDGSTMRPMYSIFNRDSLYNSSTFWSSDKFQWQAGKRADVLGSMAFSVGKVNLSGAVLSLFPPSSGSAKTIFFDFYGTENYSNQIRMKRPTGATGAGTLDKAMRYAVSGTEPVLELGADNIGTIGISNGMIALGPFGGTNAIYAHISTPTVHIGRFTAQHGRNSLSTMQINYNAQYFYETNTGIDEYDALRLNNTSGKKWSIGADNNGKFYLNNTTDALRAFEIPVEGGIIPTKRTATQMSALSSPKEGAVFYVTDTNGTFTAKGWWGYDGSAWQKLN